MKLDFNAILIEVIGFGVDDTMSKSLRDKL